MNAALILIAACAPIFAQDLSHLEIEKIATGFHYAEGPVWSRGGFLIFSDVPTNRVLQMAPPENLQQNARVAPMRDNSAAPTETP